MCVCVCVYMLVALPVTRAVALLPALLVATFTTSHQIYLSYLSFCRNIDLHPHRVTSG